MASEHVLEITSANFEQDVLNSPVPVLVDFWAVWCGPCKAIAPVLDQIADDLGGKLKIGKVDVDQERDLALQYDVRSIPNLVLFKDGKAVHTMVGAKPKDALLKELQPHLG